jgi:hypothetical protein
MLGLSTTEIEELRLAGIISEEPPG